MSSEQAAAGARKTVVVTGATGYVASRLLPAFRERYDLRLVDVTREGRGVSVFLWGAGQGCLPDAGGRVNERRLGGADGVDPELLGHRPHGRIDTV